MSTHALTRRGAVIAALLTLLAMPAAAQMPAVPSAPQTAPEPRIVVGPVGLTPAIAITDIGTDSNVFNEQTDPQSDFTATVIPSVTAQMHAGNVQLSGLVSLGLVYYNRFKEQQSINGTYQGSADMPLNRLRPWVSFAYSRTSTRPGFEIDLRARRTEPRITVGTEIRVSGRSWINLAARHATFNYDENQIFEGEDLRTTLNRNQDAWSGALHFSVTPLTTFVIVGEAERIRFDFGTLRNADSIRVMPGFEFSPDALFRGKAYAGYRRYTALGAGVPEYSGPVMAVELSSTLFGTTKFDIRADRDVSYSFEELTPYYISTGAGLTITQRLVGPFDVQATGNRARLSYRALEGTDPVLIGLPPLSDGVRVDSVYTVGGGVGYHIGDTGRVGLNGEYSERSSNTSLGLPYTRVRVFASFTYEFR